MGAELPVFGHVPCSYFLLGDMNPRTISLPESAGRWAQFRCPYEMLYNGLTETLEYKQPLIMRSHGDIKGFMKDVLGKPLVQVHGETTGMSARLFEIQGSKAGAAEFKKIMKALHLGDSHRYHIHKMFLNGWIWREQDITFLPTYKLEKEFSRNSSRVRCRKYVVDDKSRACAPAFCDRIAELIPRGEYTCWEFGEYKSMPEIHGRSGSDHIPVTLSVKWTDSPEARDRSRSRDGSESSRSRRGSMSSRHSPRRKRRKTFTAVKDGDQKESSPRGQRRGAVCRSPKPKADSGSESPRERKGSRSRSRSKARRKRKSGGK